MQAAYDHVKEVGETAEHITTEMPEAVKEGFPENVETGVDTERLEKDE